MSASLTTLIAALIGALIGSIGAVFIEFWLSGRVKDRQARRLIAQKYLYQLQEASESLWYRIDNLNVFSREIQDKGYFEFTTLYSVGKILACERILSLNGVYPLLIDFYPGLTNIFRIKIYKIIGKIGLNHYDRIALSESLIEAVDGQFRLSTFTEFRQRYEISNQKNSEWLVQARKAIQTLQTESTRKKVSELMTEVAKEISKKIKVKTSLPEI